MIPWGAGIGRGKNFTLGTPIFISRRALSSTDKVTCTPRVLIPSNSFTLALHSCMLSGCPCVCVCVCVCVCSSVCVHVSIPVPITLGLSFTPCISSLSASLSSPACLPPHYCLYWHLPHPSRTVFLSCLMAVSSLSASVPSFLPFIPLSSLLFSPPLSLFFFLLPPPSIPSLPPVPPLLSLSLPLPLCLSLHQYLTPRLSVPQLQ